MPEPEDRIVAGTLRSLAQALSGAEDMSRTAIDQLRDLADLVDPEVDAPPSAPLHRARSAEERGEGICRTCLLPIWNEGGEIGHRKVETGWSDRIERGGDSLVCFKAIDYRHVPLTGREAAIYDHAVRAGQAAVTITIGGR